MKSTYLASIALAVTVGGASVAFGQVASSPADAGSAPSATTGQTAPASSSHRSHRGWSQRRLFHGVQLTADERTQLKGIRNTYRPQVRTLRHQAHVTRSTLRSAEAQRDSAAITAARSTMHETRAQFATLHEHWMGDARGVLTPDQQAQFDHNVAEMKATRHRAHSAQ